jgi:transcriptional regulator with XRE-family HTH domain
MSSLLTSADRRRQTAAWLAEALRQRRWTQHRLAEEAGVSRPTIWTILTERADAKEETIERLAAALGVRPPWLAEQAPLGEEGVIRLIAELVSNAVRRTLEATELHTGRDGPAVVSEALLAFAERLVAQGVTRAYLADIYEAIARLGKMQQALRSSSRPKDRDSQS